MQPRGRPRSSRQRKTRNRNNPVSEFHSQPFDNHQLSQLHQIQQQQQQHAQQATQQQTHHQSLQNDDIPGFSFPQYDLNEQAPEPMWLPNPQQDGNTAMMVAPDDAEECMDDSEDPFWNARPSRPSYSEDSVQNVVPNVSGQMPTSSRHQHPTSPDQVQQLHQLTHNLSPDRDTTASSSSHDVKEELREIQRRREAHNQLSQGGQHTQHTQEQTLSPLQQHEQQDLMQQLHRQISNSASSPVEQQRHQQQPQPQRQEHVLSPQHPLVPPHPLSRQHTQENTHQSFCLPQNRSGSYSVKHEHEVRSQQQLAVHSRRESHHPPLQNSLPGIRSDGEVDKEKYVRQAGQAAEQAKLEKRKHLKDQQRLKEEEAEARGGPLTAKDKERERSRRESAVTRRRAEVYIEQLESYARKVPYLEENIVNLQRELETMRRLVHGNQVQQSQLQAQPQGQQTSPQHAITAVMPVLQGHGGVKVEPGLALSPDSAGTTKLVSRIRDLDL